MDDPNESHEPFADLSPLPSVSRQPSYMSKEPVSVSLVSLFSMDQQPSQAGLLPQLSRNPSLIQMELSPRAHDSSSGKILLQKPPLSSGRPPAHTTLISSLKFPNVEGMTQIIIPQGLSSRGKRKSPTEKLTKAQNVNFPMPPVVSPRPIKAQVEPFESVRSKLRDSLASALALASGERQIGQQSQPKSMPLTSNPPEGTPLNDTGLKDDLLQENGLCWVAEVSPREKSTETRDGGAAKRARVDFEESGDKNRALAASIEAELFRLFGGVNKKYKEKGRSLLFNLKDPSNPELRTRVYSGEITPQQLCSMSAEELASKELTEWRMAKAEEFAHMVVLQDSDVDLRRVVKKTHKGEVQVEVEDDSASVEVAVGSTSLLPVLAKSKADLKSEKKDDAVADEVELSGSLTGAQPHDMQELMVDGKGAESLPAIVSLDEFMEALNSEPPFEVSPAAAGDDVLPQDSPPDVKAGASGDSLDISSQHEEIESTKAKEVDAETVASGIDPPKPGEQVSVGSMPGHLWEGVIQLTVSSLTTVQGFFKSGEKASTKDWPAIVEVKGRVRVEAFEKFLRDLPLSKSRAMMVVHLLWKEGSPEGGRKAISEAAESYITDERLGYVEPCPGVELYVCPPGRRTAQMLGEHTGAEQADAILMQPDGSAVSGLVGIVVWRRALVESPRPLSSHHHHQKHSSSKRSSLSRKQQRPLTRETPAEMNPSKGEVEEVGEDVPPGFGPVGASAGEEDDLPEFDFRGGSAPLPATERAAARPAYHIRELIHKYGGQDEQVKTRPVRPWEDDDDIPEWRPHTQAPAAYPQQVFPQQTLPQQFAPPQPPPLEHPGFSRMPQFLPHPPVQSGVWAPHGGQGFAAGAGDQRGMMDWRYDVNRTRGL